MKAVFFTSILHILVHTSAGAHDLFTEYRLSAALADDDYILHWNVDLEGKEISFAINVRTTGWVGLGISPNGQMPGSDVVIAWVDENGQVIFNDRYANGRFLPSIDDSQDWTLISGEEEDGRTIIEFTRPFQSCDTDNDLDIFADTTRIVWAYHSLDPTSEEDLGTLQHEGKGSASLNLLGGLNEDRVEEEGSSFTILNDDVLLPENDTTYWCTVHALPNETVTQEKFIYKFSPVLSDSSASYVHHIVVYLCSNLNHSHVGTSERCSGTEMPISLCKSSGVIIAVWAYGGPDFVFPTGVGYPIGGKGQQFLIVEIHYDNPLMLEDIVDNSGLEFFYTNEPPENRAGLLTLGQIPLSNLVIPPNADNFVVNAMCSEQCTTQFIPDDGITVFGNMFHTHLAGHGLVVRHLRETAACGGVEELQPIDENTRYDFNYQQTTLFPRPAQVLPGDVLHLECSYRTSDPSYQSVTLGGESTRDEMCYAFLYYYPEVELLFCFGSQLANEEFAEEYLKPGDSDVLQATMLTNDRQSVREIFDQVEWDQQAVNSFQNSIQSNTFFDYCASSNAANSLIDYNGRIPEVDCPYVAESKDCPVSGANTIQYFGYTFLLGVAFLQKMIILN